MGEGGYKSIRCFLGKESLKEELGGSAGEGGSSIV